MPPSDPNETNWIVQVNESLKCMPANEQQYWKKRSIYRVPACVTDLNRKAFQPQAVSFGPYHHGKAHLRTMEDHKHHALLHFLRRSGKPLDPFLKSLREVARDLEESYDTLDLEWKEGGGDGEANRFLKVMITDGCFMLEILRSATQVVDDYEPDDPILYTHRMLSIMPYIWPDMLMLENQLPMLVLDRLVAVESDGKEAHRAWIWFKKSKIGSLTDISFASGVLSLNLIAFERFHVRTRNEVTSNIYFMDYIIDNKCDVALLYNLGIVLTVLGDDKETMELFHLLAKYTTIEPNDSFIAVCNKVNEYCNKPWSKWRSNFIETYFRGPWALWSFMAAIFLCALAIIQTIYFVLRTHSLPLFTIIFPF
ncbi:hypothetical protein ACJRO7_004631 [Eucalyptus globulus]|uniref:Uncharacterized protein n=1 Tax=Eucalyptus globulus TaxID=34317 RepID=A0ABD3IZG8_EUCGL